LVLFKGRLLFRYVFSQGCDKAVQFIKDNPELIDEFKQKILLAKGLIEEK
jgi:hypothetical protein